MEQPLSSSDSMISPVVTDSAPDGGVEKHALLAQDGKAPAFFAWSLEASSNTENEDLPIPGLNTRSVTAPFGVDNQDSNQWQSEYNSSNQQALGAPSVLLVAGAVSAARESPPHFFYWPVVQSEAPPKKSHPLITGTEHSDNFNWPIDETSPTLIPHPPAIATPTQSSEAPFGVWKQSAFSPAAWKSEYTANFDTNLESVPIMPPLPPVETVHYADLDDEDDDDEEEEDNIVVPEVVQASGPTQGRKLRFTTEHRSSFTWPDGGASIAKATSAPSKKLAAMIKEESVRESRSNMTTIMKASYKWPSAKHYASNPNLAKRQSNASDPNMLSHANVAIVLKADIQALREGMDALLEANDAILSESSQAEQTGTAGAVVEDSITTLGNIVTNLAYPADALSVPASSVTGPTTKTVGSRQKRDLAVVGSKIKIPMIIPASGARASTPKSGVTGTTPRTQNSVSRILNKIKAKNNSSENPVFRNKRYPSGSDKQNKRWLTESRSQFVVHASKKNK